jgi:hypothetical protein
MMATALLLLASAAEAPVQVTIIAEPPNVPFHRQIKFTISVEAPADAEIELPQMIDHFAGLPVYGQTDFRTEKASEGRKRITETYTLDPLFPGIYTPDAVTIGVAGAPAITVASPTLRVRELTPDEQMEIERFIPSDGPIDLERRFWESWLFWSAVAAIAALALAVAAQFLRRGRARRVYTPPRPPWEIAYGRLRELDAKKWPEAGRYGPYYVELSAILRHYIEDRFHLHAPERTTPEFLSEAAGSGVLSEGHQRLLAHFLRHCDRVKFARYEPSVSEMERSFTEVLTFVDETVPKPAAAEGKAA